MKTILMLSMLSSTGCLVPKFPVPQEGRQSETQAPPSATDPRKDGSRVKAMWYVGEDGLRVPSGNLRDTALGVACSPREVSPGDLTCFPAGPGVISGGLTSAIYADSGCAQLAVRDPARVYTFKDVTEAWHAFAVTARTASQAWIRDDTGACVTFDLGPGVAAYVVGEEITGSLVRLLEQETE